MANIITEIVEIGKNIPNLTGKMYDTFVKYKKNMTINLGAKFFSDSVTAVKKEEKAGATKQAQTTHQETKKPSITK